MSVFEKLKRKLTSGGKKGAQSKPRVAKSTNQIQTQIDPATPTRIVPVQTTVLPPPPEPDGPAPSRIQSNVQASTKSNTNNESNNNVNVAKCHNNARSEVEKWAKRCLDKGIQGMREEFAELKRFVPPDMCVTTFTANWELGKNRYKDVPCQDKCRVILKWPGQSNDYIHANYVATPISDKRFICTQGPLDVTITDFWHMIIQEETETIIMLCNIKEKGMDKCAQYWPLEEKEVKKCDDVEVTNTQVRPMSNEEQSVKLSVLQLKWKEDGKERTREVRHYQWIDWPDRGVPPCRLTAMVLLSFVRGTKKPIAVHCSAGIGRTGTIVAIEFILERLQQGHSCEAMDEILKELRSQRPWSIQTDLQYLYVVRVMLFYFFDKYKLASSVSEEVQTKYKKFIEDYNAATQ